MKFLIALVAVLALVSLSQALVIPKEAQPAQLSSMKCKACQFLDKFLLEAEDLSGFALQRFLDKKCNKIGMFKTECKMLVGTAVDYVEKYGHKLDENELCHKLISVC